TAEQNDYEGGKNQGKQLLQELGQYVGHGELHSFDVIDDGRNQAASGVLLIKSGRATQDGIVKIITQIGDHAEAGVVDQISSRIIQDSFENGGSNQGEGDDCPRILEVRRHELLQVNCVARSGQFEELHL